MNLQSFLFLLKQCAGFPPALQRGDELLIGMHVQLFTFFTLDISSYGIPRISTSPGFVRFTVYDLAAIPMSRNSTSDNSLAKGICLTFNDKLSECDYFVHIIVAMVG